MFEKDGPMRSPEHEYMQIKLRQLENPLSESECDLIAGRVLRGAHDQVTIWLNFKTERLSIGADDLGNFWVCFGTALFHGPNYTW